MVYRRPDQSSEKVNLTKGNLYYMELLHKENTLIDFMCVGAMFPTLSRERPISSRHLVMESTGTIKDYIIDCSVILLQIVMVSPVTHLVKNYESQSEPMSSY